MLKSLSRMLSGCVRIADANLEPPRRSRLKLRVLHLTLMLVFRTPYSILDIGAGTKIMDSFSATASFCNGICWISS